MNRLAILIVGLSVLTARARTSDSSPIAPSSGRRPPPPSPSPLSPANEVPAITNADASGSGTATIALTVTKDGSGNITSATANFQIGVPGFRPGPRDRRAHSQRRGRQQCRDLRQCRSRIGGTAITNGSGSIDEERDQRAGRPGGRDSRQSRGALLQRPHGAQSRRGDPRSAAGGRHDRGPSSITGLAARITGPTPGSAHRAFRDAALDVLQQRIDRRHAARRIGAPPSDPGRGGRAPPVPPVRRGRAPTCRRP